MLWWQRIKCICLGHEWMTRGTTVRENQIHMELHCFHCFATTSGIDINRGYGPLALPSIGSDVPGGGAF